MWFLVALAILFPLFFPPDSLAHSETSIIRMTPNGFEPQTITLDENSAVLFVNKDKVARWPASNVHPTHDLYPEFDPQKAVAPGGSWAFKPKKVGEWKYHDHLLPHIRGTITVTSEKWEVGSGKEDMDSGVLPKILDWFREWLQEFMNRISGLLSQTKQMDAGKRWTEIKQKYQGQAGSEGDIHDQAHLTGSLIFKEKGFAGIGLCSAEFAFGCFHGFLDEAFKKDLSKITEAQEACSKLGPGQSGPVASCIHGIGHGVASFHQSSDLKSSLADCRKLTLGREYCFDGVFMEFVRSAPESFFKKDDPLYPCNELEKEYGPAYSFACGRNQPSLLMSRFNKGFSEVVDICRTASSKPFKQACFDSLGFSLAASGDVSKIIAGCQSILIPEFVLKCAKAAAGELVFQEVPGWSEKSAAVCESFPPGRSECLFHVDRLIKEYNRSSKINFTPQKKGEDPNSYIRSQMKICYESNGADGCYKKVAKLLYDNFGLAKTLGLLATNEEYPEVYARCHEVAHYLSRSEYERLGSIAKVYAQCDSTCHGGCYHGTMEAFLKEKQVQFGNNLSSEFAKVCGSPKDYQKPLEFNECLHGMGHAAMFITDMELPKSLSLCDGLNEQNAKERCFSGVFMENSSSSTGKDHQSRFVKADDPFYPCNSLEERYLTICWRYQSSYFSVIFHDDWPKVVDLCLKVPNRYQSECFRTIGTNQVGFTQDPLVMKANCKLAPTDDLQRVCVTGVVSSFAYRFVGNGSKMINFCSSVSEGNKADCFKQIGASFSDWTFDKEVAKAECRKIPDGGGRDWCLSVI